jgi:hypothetical protein
MLKLKLCKSLLPLFFSVILAFGACTFLPDNKDLEKTSYRIGDRGPAGGWIFYDKGALSDGWRYLEAAPDDLGPTEWGCVGLTITDARETGIGAGRTNTQAIVKTCREPDCAARLAVKYNAGVKDDWFLPSRDELKAMYLQLQKNGLGNFQNIYYWSSSEQGPTASWYQSFGTGDQSYNDKDYFYGLVRPVRAF